MSVRKAFADAWETKFPDTPVPTNLSFLDDEGVSSLASALDSSERTMNKLQDELSRQQFIYDFVLQRLNVSIAARSDRRSVSPGRRAGDDWRKVPVSKTPSAPRPTYGQPARAHGKASQLATVMAKIGIGKVNRPAIDPEDEGRLYCLDDGGKKVTPLSRFHEKSNMYRASSEPSLLDYDRKFKPQPAIPPPTNSRIPPGFKPVFTKDEHSKPSSSFNAYTTADRRHKQESDPSATALRKSTGSYLDYGPRWHTEEPATRTQVYLETNLDSVIPPPSTSPPYSQPPVDRFQLDVCDGTGPVRPPRHRSHIYEEPMDLRHQMTNKEVEDEADDDEAASSDEEPIYFNMLKFREQVLSHANALYMSTTDNRTSSSSSELDKTASVQRRLRRNAHHYEYIEPHMTKLSVFPVDTHSGI